MLGKHIKDLRRRQGIGLGELAAGAALSQKELLDIEADNVTRLPGATLLRIADGLNLKKATDFASLMRLNGVTRRFHAYCVGLPKTGTVSLAGIFGNYRAAHEMWQWDTHQAIIRHNQQEMPKQAFLDFLRDRDANGMLEMDSAHFNRHYLGYLAEEFPNAFFICTIRDCYSWVNSYVNYFTSPKREAIQALELENGVPFDLPRGDCAEKRDFVENFPVYIDKLLSHWAKSYHRMILALPAGRSLIVRTHELAGNIDKMAKLLSIPPHTLIREKSHLNRGTYHVDILSRCGLSFLKAKFDTHCGRLMETWFPGYGVEDYLNKNAVPLVHSKRNLHFK